jgi:hypothetical protein
MLFGPVRIFTPSQIIQALKLIDKGESPTLFYFIIMENYMDNNTVTIDTSQFSDFAKYNQDILEMIIGCIVIHSEHGQGKITTIKLRPDREPKPVKLSLVQQLLKIEPQIDKPKPRTPLITIFFENGELLFESDGFKGSYFGPITVPKKFYDLALQRKNEYEIQLSLAKQEEERKRKAEAIENKARIIEKHKIRILNLGIQYKGFRYLSKINNHRITHCYNCKKDLDNYIDIECSICGYIICSCGACMCR